eukprot:gene42469-52670_t
MPALLSLSRFVFALVLASLVHVADAQAPRPLYRDPVFDGAADAAVVFNKQRGRWEMFYTNRRATQRLDDPKDVSWVHGTRIGIASTQDGNTWHREGDAEFPAECTGGTPERSTHWAPEIIEHEGRYHLWLTVVPGIHSRWTGRRFLQHLTSTDLRRWQCADQLELGSQRIIDASVVRLDDGRWRLWFKDEAQGSRLFAAESADLKQWKVQGPITAGAAEGPKVFRFKGQWWLVADLVGSYEQQPPDLLAELQRDRRWCQGNLQNARLMAEPGLHMVHRSMFVTGAMAYLSAPLWLAFMTLGTALWVTGAPVLADWHILPAELLALWAWTLSMLFLPRVLGVLAVFMRSEQAQYGGALSLLKSAALESTLAILQAPVRMLAHSLFVLVALTGIALEWKSPPREAQAVPWRHAMAQLAPMTAVIALLAAGIGAIDSGALLWLAPVGVPLALAIPMAVVTSQIALGRTMRAQRFLLIPEEAWSPPVLRRAWRHAQRLAQPRLPLAPAASMA